ncbi:WhiB family transcriptional regulator [Streptomyces sp. NPDC091371]|uniref:WhiB family transcriptional regulator n=1 Tax=Streptomyces sp. NPDC091371 TaxID=3155303 RepID=UPI003427A161
MVTTVRTTPPTSLQVAGASTPLPCQRRPDIFGQPLLANPPAGGAGLPLQTRRRQALAHAARQLCSSCPLWAECLRDAVTQSDPGGYAAATTRQDRRWIRRRIGIGDGQGRLSSWPVGGERPAEVDIDAVLEAFHALQEHWVNRPALSAAGEGTRAGPGGVPVNGKAHRSAASGEPKTGQQRVNTHEVSMAAPAGERITFSLDDPARAVQKAVLGPLVRSALPTLEATEQIAAMLVRMPAAGLRPELLDALREVRRCLEAWRTASGEDAPYHPAAGGGLTGSVSAELATSDPLSVLRHDIFEPLLHRFAESIRRIEVLTAVLTTAPDGADPGADATGAEATGGGCPHGPELAAVHASLGRLGVHIEQYAADAPRFQAPDRTRGGAYRDTPLRSVPDLASGSVLPEASWNAPSLRRAVEQAVGSFPGPFTGRDVLLALPRGAYHDPAKSVSNALSAMAKSGRLLRISRGTYAVASPSSGVLAASS